MISTVKHLLSFLYEQPVEKNSSPVNPYLEVTYHRGNYKLSTPHAIYSFGTEYKNFADAFRILKIPSPHIKTVLCLGFGLGSIPLILEKRQHGSPSGRHYTGVEVDPAVIELAKKYMAPGILEKTELLCRDAFEFVKNCTEKFDLITVDIFIDSEIPGKFEQQEFLENVKKLLGEKGMLLYNCIAGRENQRKKSMDFFHAPFKDVFPSATILSLDKNLMLVAGKH